MSSKESHKNRSHKSYRTRKLLKEFAFNKFSYMAFIMSFKRDKKKGGH